MVCFVPARSGGLSGGQAAASHFVVGPVAIVSIVAISAYLHLLAVPARDRSLWS